MQRAVRDLERCEEITDVDAVLGSYDIIASGAFENSRRLTDFIEHVESKPFYQSCFAQPSHETWRRRKQAQSTRKGWVLVKSGSPSATVRDLKKLPSVQKVVLTSGDFNIVANFSVRDPGNWRRTVFEDIQGATGVRDTVTLPGLSD
jgi:DNA-binding Lrp family transcriptional regulator